MYVHPRGRGARATPDSMPVALPVAWRGIIVSNQHADYMYTLHTVQCIHTCIQLHTQAVWGGPRGVQRVVWWYNTVHTTT